MLEVHILYPISYKAFLIAHDSKYLPQTTDYSYNSSSDTFDKQSIFPSSKAQHNDHR